VRVLLRGGQGEPGRGFLLGDLTGIEPMAVQATRFESERGPARGKLERGDPSKSIWWPWDKDDDVNAPVLYQ